MGLISSNDKNNNVEKKNIFCFHYGYSNRRNGDSFLEMLKKENGTSYELKHCEDLSVVVDKNIDPCENVGKYFEMYYLFSEYKVSKLHVSIAINIPENSNHNYIDTLNKIVIYLSKLFGNNIFSNAYVVYDHEEKYNEKISKKNEINNIFTKYIFENIAENNIVKNISVEDIKNIKNINNILKLISSSTEINTIEKFIDKNKEKKVHNYAWDFEVWHPEFDINELSKVLAYLFAEKVGEKGYTNTNFFVNIYNKINDRNEAINSKYKKYKKKYLSLKNKNKNLL